MHPADDQQCRASLLQAAVSQLTLDLLHGLCWTKLTVHFMNDMPTYKVREFRRDHKHVSVHTYMTRHLMDRFHNVLLQ